MNMPSLTPLFIAALACSLAAGAILHELTHYVMARLAGADAWFEWPPAVVFAVPVDTPTWVDRWINISPQVIGLSVGLPLLYVYGVPTDGPGLAALCGWLMYVWGSLEDLSYAKAHGEEAWIETRWRALTEREQDAAIAVTAWAVATAMYVGGSLLGPRAALTAALLAVAPLTVTAYYVVRAVVDGRTRRTDAA